MARAYAQAVRDAKQMDITSASPEKFAQLLKESYPFHFAIRDLYARFRENPGFQQTRGLIRLMRVLVSRLFDPQAGKADTARPDPRPRPGFERPRNAGRNLATSTRRWTMPSVTTSPPAARPSPRSWTPISAARTRRTSASCSWSPRWPTCPMPSWACPCLR